MLNVFPIQFLAPLAYTLLRVCVGLILIYLGARRVKHRSPLSLVISETSTFHPVILLLFGIVEIFAGTLLFLGFYTQIVALIGMALSLMQILSPVRFSQSSTLPRIFFLLLFFVSLSLFITGAGSFAFDLPI